MKRLIASLCAGAAVLAPSASMAQTNNLLQAEGTFTYECSVDPVSVVMDNSIVAGRLLGSGNGFGFSQTGDTTWTLSVGEVGGDINGQQLKGTFQIRWDESITNRTGPEVTTLENDGTGVFIGGVTESTFISGQRTGTFDAIAQVRTLVLGDSLQPGTYQLNQVLSCYSQNQFGFADDQELQ